MRREAQAVVYVVLGAVLLKLVISGEYLNYVRTVLKPFLIITAVLLITFGVLGFMRDWRGRAAVERLQQRSAEARIRTHGPGSAELPIPAEPDADQPDADQPQPPVVGTDEHDEHDEHEHGSEGHGVGWLWVLPIFVLVLVPPPALGSFAAERGAVTVPKPPESVSYPALTGSDPVALEVHDYARRAVWDGGRTLTGRTVNLSGFVTPHTGGSWYLTRMKVNCCAADARPFQVQVVNSPRRVVRDAWVRVTGTWLPSTSSDPWKATPLISAVTVQIIPTPAQPYE
jgi:uncharacterized repeat protein (TIGR03943 family)